MWIEEIERQGFAVVPGVLDENQVLELQIALLDDSQQTHARRGILEIAEVQALARSRVVRELLSPLLGEEFLIVRGLFFDKTPAANWKVPWHQDLVVAVREKREIEGWSGWSIKDGVPHVQPPTEVLEQMLTVRLHLDACDGNNGALRVVPYSHRGGKVASDSDVWKDVEMIAETVSVPAGGALLMRPLLWHASSKSTSLSPRRVVHLECAPASLSELPNGLEWRWALRN